MDSLSYLQCIAEQILFVVKTLEQLMMELKKDAK